jgi:hypothetical protein
VRVEQQLCERVGVCARELHVEVDDLHDAPRYRSSSAASASHSSSCTRALRT